MNDKRIVYVDMDNVIVDFKSGIQKLSNDQQESIVEFDEVEGIFALMEPMPGSIEAVKKLASSPKLDVYILSTAPWLNPSAWADKIRWVHNHFGEDESNPLYKRLIISHHKNLNQGDYLIDDRLKSGADKFVGTHIHFGEANEKEGCDGSYPDWDSVLAYFEEQGLLD